MMPTDQQFIEQLEACTLAEALFDHAGHVRAGFIYLQRLPFGAAIDTMRETLIRFARSLGREGRYHDTITVAYLAAIRERLSRERAGISWDEFAARHADLLDRHFLRTWYSDEVLELAEARAVFLLPQVNKRD